MKMANGDKSHWLIEKKISIEACRNSDAAPDRRVFEYFLLGRRIKVDFTNFKQMCLRSPCK